MFSEVQRDYIKQLALSNRDKYPYYIAYTNSNTGGSSTSNDYNFYIILSKEPIEASTRYRYVIPSGSICLGVRSGSASSYNYAERVVNLSVPTTLTVDNWEFVYTNAEFTGVSMQPDILASDVVSESHFDGFGIAICIILLSVIFFKLIKG